MSNILYIPGLGGERNIKSQRLYLSFLNLLRSSANHIHLFDPEWETEEDYQTKYGRLVDFYESIGKPEKVFAVSAGASLAVSLTVECTDIDITHLICGKVTGSNKIGDNYQKRAPAFVQSVERSEDLVAAGVDGSRFVCYVPKDEGDTVIESVDMLVPDSRVVDLPHLKHAQAIGYALVRYLPRIK